MIRRKHQIATTGGSFYKVTGQSSPKQPQKTRTKGPSQAGDEGDVTLDMAETLGWDLMRSHDVRREPHAT